VGEAEFGLLDGVLKTRPGWLGPGEVVEVTFDPEVVTYRTLLDHARAKDCTKAVYTRTDAQHEVAQEVVGDKAKRSDEAIRVEGNKYYLTRSALRSLPLTEAQAARVHAGLVKGEWKRWLSPRQRGLLERLEAVEKRRPDWKAPVAIGKPLIVAWTTLETVLEAAEKQ